MFYTVFKWLFVFLCKTKYHINTYSNRISLHIGKVRCLLVIIFYYTVKFKYCGSVPRFFGLFYFMNQTHLGP